MRLQLPSSNGFLAGFLNQQVINLCYQKNIYKQIKIYRHSKIPPGAANIPQPILQGGLSPSCQAVPWEDKLIATRSQMTDILTSNSLSELGWMSLSLYM